MDVLASRLPATPAELVQAEPNPVARVVLITQSGQHPWGNLPKQWADQRLEDIAAALQAGVTQAQLVDMTGLSRPRMSQLCEKALGRVSG